MDEGVNLLASVYCNAHEILNPDGSDVDLGFGIFVRACLFNHSCDPNCVWFVGQEPPATKVESRLLILHSHSSCFPRSKFLNIMQPTQCERCVLNPKS